MDTINYEINGKKNVLNFISNYVYITLSMHIVKLGTNNNNKIEKKNINISETHQIWLLFQK